MERCMGCMEEIREDAQVCPCCGYVRNTDVKEAYYLLPGQMVGEKYIAGRVLGYGGFGVTYLGWDTVLKRKVAVKEYLPSDFATRSYGTKMLTVFSGEAADQFEAGLNSFISEAKRLAKFNRVPQIVDIYDCFMENGTGYIIMEYLEGQTVKELLKEKQKLPAEEVKQIVMEVLKGLSEVHKEGIIHRDIAPDNIFITKNNEVKILDFGAARYATAVQSRSLSVILKPGYAPEEQYRSRGEQGPWTDVYALGATCYRMITGIRPEEAIERLAEDHVKPPSELGVSIDSNMENALMNSLNIRREYRIPDAESFYNALNSKAEVARVTEETAESKDMGMPLWQKISVAAAAAFACVFLVLVAAGKIRFGQRGIESGKSVPVLAEGESYMPDISGMSYEDAEAALKEKNVHVVINGMNYSESIEKNRILSQKPKNGEKIRREDTVYVIMSGGNQEVMMPDLSGMEYEEAARLLKAQNLVLKEEVSEEYSDLIEKGRVMEQSVAAEERIGVLTEIALTVSLGSLSEETAELTVPDLRGLTRKEAMKELEKLKEETGFTYALGDVQKEHSAEVEKNRIISQSLEPGTKARTNEPISLVISLGPEMVQVPDLLYASREDAVKRLEEAGLTAEIREDYSSQVQKGLVISQNPDADSQAAKGSTVTIVISLGAKPAEKKSESGGQNTPPPQETPSQDQPAPPPARDDTIHLEL